VTASVTAGPRALLEAALPSRNPDLPDSFDRKALRWAKTAVWVLIAIVTLQSMLLVAGAWRNDRQIDRPELGVLYPSELAAGMRIYVEYATSDPNLVRVQNRNAALAIIPAGSLAVAGWLIGAAMLAGLVRLERRETQPKRKVHLKSP
jgi:hypothetical protein